MRKESNVVRLAENAQGRDFCVGDLHGMYALLEKLLSSARFDPLKDRLISVGDLIDRGPDSARALKYLNEPWFYAIRGNHEQLLIDCYENPDDVETRNIWLRNGGHWWEAQSASIQLAFYRRLSRLPFAFEIPTKRGLIGVVHADIPEKMSWDVFTDELNKGDENSTTIALWSRKRAKNLDTADEVAGIKEIYCGHTIFPTLESAANVHFIDTGAYLRSQGRLTLVDLQHGPDYRYSLSAIK